MHFLKIIHGYPPNYNAGSEVYSQSIVNELAKRHKVTVFTREENEYELDFRFRRETQNGIDFVFVNMARGKDGYNHKLLNQRFAELIAKIKPDVAHIGHLNHLSTGIVAILQQAGVPMVYTLHDFWLMCPRGQFLQRNFDGQNLLRLCDGQDNRKCAKSCYSMYFANYEIDFEQSLYYGFTHQEHIGKEALTDLEHWTNWIDARMHTMRQVCKMIDVFIAPSKYLMHKFLNEFEIPNEKMLYLDYGFPMHYLKPVVPKTTDVFTFGYIGTHIPAKGINLLLEAFAKLNKPAKLKIFGRTNGQSTVALKKMASRCPNTVEFCGEYINENLAEVVFNHVDAIVVPSVWGENSPLVIHEAQACHIPVLTANFGGMGEYVHHLVNGLLFEHRNAQSLYEQLLYAVENPQQMVELGKRGYLFSENGLVPDIETHCMALENIYNDTIKNYERKTVADNAGY